MPCLRHARLRPTRPAVTRCSGPLVLARIIEPTSKLDSLRVLAEAGVDAPSYATLKRRLPPTPKPSWRRGLRRRARGTRRWGRRRWCSTTCPRSTSRPIKVTGSASRVLQGTPAGTADHHRAAYRRLRVPADGRGVRGQQGRDRDDAADVQRVHGRPPAHRCHRRRGRRDDLGGQPAPRSRPQGCRSSSATGSRHVPYVIEDGAARSGGRIPDGHMFPSRGRRGRTSRRRDQVIYYQYRADRARRTLRGIDEQVAKAEKAVAGKRRSSATGSSPYRRRRESSTANSSQGPRRWPGSRATSPTSPNPTPEFVIGAYHQLWHIEKSFRMSKHDLRARPIYHHNANHRRTPDHRVRRTRRHPTTSRARTGGRSRFVAPPAATAPSRSAPAGDPHRRRPTPDDLRDALAVIT